MPSNTVDIFIRNARSKHEGGTKHYALALLSIEVEDKGGVYVVARIHGGLGKASRVNVEYYSHLSQAEDQYSSVMFDKRKRGYNDLAREDTVLFEKTLNNVSSAAELFSESDEIRLSMTNVGMTSNHKVESFSQLLPEDDHVMIANLVNHLLSTQGTEPFVDPVHSPEPKVDPKKLLEQKRLENYGEKWGSW